MKPVPKRALVLALLVCLVSFAQLYITMQPRIEVRNRVNCYSNLKRIGLGLMQYLQDYDETYPRAWYGKDAGPSDAATNYKWMDALFPYVKNESIFTCPKDGARYRYRDGTNYGSYVMNNAYFKTGDKQTPPSGVRMDQILTQTVFVTDGANDFQFAWPDAKHMPKLIGDRFFQLSSIRGRHGGVVNGSALPLGVDGACMTSLLRFETKTKKVNGATIYPLLTIEDD
jgi:hypothetical protein